MAKGGKCKGWPMANMKPESLQVSANGLKTLTQSMAGAILNPATAHAEGKDLKTGMGSIKSAK